MRPRMKQTLEALKRAVEGQGAPREDAWAYTPEHRAQLTRARADRQAGRVRTLAEADLKELAP